LLGQALELHIQRCRHAQAAVSHHLRAVQFFELLAHVDGKVGRFEADFLGRERQRLQIGGLGLALVDVPFLNHHVQHQPLARARAFEVGERVKFDRALRQPGQKARLAQRQVGRRLAKVGARRGLDAVGQIAVVDLIQVHLQHFVLVELLGHAPGQDDLLELALVGNSRALFVVEGHVADELLGDGATADGARFGIAEVGNDRGHQRRRVEADVLIEGVVFDSDGGLDEVRRNLAQRHTGALALAEDLPQHFAVAVHDLRRLERLAGARRLQRSDARLQLARPVGIDQPTGGGRAADTDEQNQGDDAQDGPAHAATAAPRALSGQVGRDVLNGLLIGLHKSLGGTTEFTDDKN